MGEKTDYDMLARLYDLEADRELEDRISARGIRICRAMAPDTKRVFDFVLKNFNEDWAYCAQNCIVRHDCYIAVRGTEILGFACNEASTLNYFGPIGVLEKERGNEVGRALLLKCMLAMKEKGYNYAIIGWVGPADFYRRCLGAVPIENSVPGSYHNLIRNTL